MTFGSTTASEVLLVDLEDAIQALELTGRRRRARHRAAGVAGAGAAHDERHARGRGTVARPPRFRGRRRDDDQIGGMPPLQRVGAVRQQRIGVAAKPLAPHNRLEQRRQLVTGHTSPSRSCDVREEREGEGGTHSGRVLVRAPHGRQRGAAARARRSAAARRCQRLLLTSTGGEDKQGASARARQVRRRVVEARSDANPDPTFWTFFESVVSVV